MGCPRLLGVELRLELVAQLVLVDDVHENDLLLLGDVVDEVLEVAADDEEAAAPGWTSEMVVWSTVTSVRPSSASTSSMFIWTIRLEPRPEPQAHMILEMAMVRSFPLSAPEGAGW